MKRCLPLLGSIVVALPLCVVGCRCGHERAVSEYERPAPARAEGRGETKGEASADIETWEPSLRLIPESMLRVVDDAEEIQPPQAATDELWVVARSAAAAPTPAGRLGAVASEREKSMTHDRGGPRPMSISAVVAGFVASVDVRHALLNASADTGEFVYELPLPEDASVREFKVTIGPRIIRGVVREREEALSIYRLARERGLTASLIDLDRSSTLRNRVANVPPGRTLELSFSYCMSLPYHDNAFELRVPLNLRAGASSGGGGGTVQPPESLAGHVPIDMHVEVDMGMPLNGVASPTHQVVVNRPSTRHANVQVTGDITTADPAFVLRCSVGDTALATAVFSHHDPTGTYVGVCLMPPSAGSSPPRHPLEAVFLLDCSESMRGTAMFTAKQMVATGIAALDSMDVFAIVTFGGRVLTEGLVPATRSHVARAVEQVRALPPSEGEGMETGLRAAAALTHREGRLPVVFMITDGCIDDPFRPIMELVSAAESRMFCICIGTAANRLLLEAIAVQGRGGVAYLRHGASSTEALGGLVAALQRPIFTGISVDLPGCTGIQIMPQRIPDLLPGRPVTVVARCDGVRPSQVIVNARGPRGAWSVELPVSPGQPPSPAMATVWARRQLSSLIRQALVDTSGSADAAIRTHALTHGLLSPLTSFLIIDTMQ